MKSAQHFRTIHYMLLKLKKIYYILNNKYDIVYYISLDKTSTPLLTVKIMTPSFDLQHDNILRILWITIEQPPPSTSSIVQQTPLISILLYIYTPFQFILSKSSQLTSRFPKKHIHLLCYSVYFNMLHMDLTIRQYYS